jgi:two-component system, OmpR family, KDP operon response regulator KdpE
METKTPARILVVDDEDQITRVLRTSLGAQGYAVESAANGVQALEKFERWKPDLIITDLSMPEIDGVELCRIVRETSKLPIIVLSVRDQERIKVQALDAGADDYVTKPFSIQELMARVRAALRRREATEAEQDANVIEAGDFLLNQEFHQVFQKGRELHLTPKEFDLLRYLLQHSHRVLTHRTLLVNIWGPYNADQPESLRVLVAQLRRKIESEEKPRYLITEPWVGYRFIPAPENTAEVSPQLK